MYLLTKWLILILVPFYAGLSMMAAFAQGINGAIAWLIILSVGTVSAVWYYDKHHGPPAVDRWETTPERWQVKLDELVDRELKERKRSD